MSCDHLLSIYVYYDTAAHKVRHGIWRLRCDYKEVWR